MCVINHLSTGWVAWVGITDLKGNLVPGLSISVEVMSRSWGVASVVSHSQNLPVRESGYVKLGEGRGKGWCGGSLSVEMDSTSECCHLHWGRKRCHQISDSTNARRYKGMSLPYRGSAHDVSHKSTCNLPYLLNQMPCSISRHSWIEAAPKKLRNEINGSCGVWLRKYGNCILNRVPLLTT